MKCFLSQSLSNCCRFLLYLLLISAPSSISFKTVKHFRSWTPLSGHQHFAIDDNTFLTEQNSIGMTNRIKWIEGRNQFQAISDLNSTAPEKSFHALRIQTSLSSLCHFLSNCFLPSGNLTRDYYHYTLWRIAQRFVSATSSVFGTQALLLALGFKQSSIGTSSDIVIYDIMRSIQVYV